MRAHLLGAGGVRGHQLVATVAHGVIVAGGGGGGAAGVIVAPANAVLTSTLPKPMPLSP